MGRLFGTDGVRGKANVELTCERALQIGRAAAAVLIGETHKKPRVLIGKDTRLSSDMLEAAIAAGLCSAGADVVLAGVVPTPAVAYLVSKMAFDAGVMISASHNPCEFNGIKIFNGDGYKLSDETEDEIEKLVMNESELPQIKNGDEVGTITGDSELVDEYIDHVASTVNTSFENVKIAVDCANGSASATARKLFGKLGADCDIICCEPNGVNINKDCGSTHLNRLSEVVKEGDYDIGIAFDGDADRFLCIDENGDVVDGDRIIAVISKDMKAKNKLDKNTVVVTVMSNLGFFKFCEKNDIKAEVTNVGDRYVLENMLENGYVIGGEQSGHIIFHKYATTGDGQLSAVKMLDVMVRSGKKLSELASEMEQYPQTLINIEVTEEGKKKYNSDKDIAQVIEQAKDELNGDGRVLVRLSGTEPLVRVMLEGKDKEQIKRLGKMIEEKIKERLV